MGIIRKIAETGIIGLVAQLWMAIAVQAEPAGARQQLADTLTTLSLEELTEVLVYSASKQDEKAFEAAAAVFVISNEDIRRSGVTTIPDALRLAPGVQVSRIDANKWAVGIRGFAGRFSNKLLVLQDGRTLYNPLFSGVYWNIQELMLEDVDRIEIIRGPGATLWGANAVNGVINIITRSARDTQGGVATASGGTWEQGGASVRYGMPIGHDSWLRMYGSYLIRDRQTTVQGTDPEGNWYDGHAGFRADMQPDAGRDLTLQGDMYRSRTGTHFFTGGNILGRWQQCISDTATMAIRMYLDHVDIAAATDPDAKFWEVRNTFDLDLQHSFTPFDSNKMIWGAGYRISQGDTNPNRIPLQPVFNPSGKTDTLASLFLQDEISLLPDLLRLTLGARLEHNDYTGWELQPTARLLLTPGKRHTLWSAVSRAVRTPSRAESDIDTQLTPTGSAPTIRLTGDKNMSAEILVAYEAGYRFRPLDTLTFDLALFYNDYQKLIGLRTGFMPPATATFQAASTSSGFTRGGELASDWKPGNWLRLGLAYSYLDMRVNSVAPSIYNTLISNVDTAPRHQVSLRGGVDLPEHVTVDLWLRYTDKISALAVGEYLNMDARVAWTPLKSLELSLVGQNLLHDSHLEYGEDFFKNPATRSERGMYGKVAWRF